MGLAMSKPERVVLTIEVGEDASVIVRAVGKERYVSTRTGNPLELLTTQQIEAISREFIAELITRASLSRAHCYLNVEDIE